MAQHPEETTLEDIGEDDETSDDEKSDFIKKEASTSSAFDVPS